MQSNPSIEAQFKTFPCLSIIKSINSFVINIVALTLTSNVLFQSLSCISSNALVINIPTLLNKISTCPYTSRTCFFNSFTACSSVTSHEKNIASPFFSRISSTTLFPFSTFLPTTITVAPSSANNFAEASPIPEVPPVINAIFPFNFPIVHLSSHILIYIFFFNSSCSKNGAKSSNGGEYKLPSCNFLTADFGSNICVVEHTTSNIQ